MQNKFKIFLWISLLLIGANGYGQKTPILSKLKEGSVTFKVFVSQWDEERDEFFSRSYINITSLDSADWTELRLLPNKDWIALLQNPEYDWGANLVLYEIYKKEAYFFKSISTRREWVKRLRETDVKFWIAKLCDVSN